MPRLLFLVSLSLFFIIANSASAVAQFNLTETERIDLLKRSDKAVVQIYSLPYVFSFSGDAEALNRFSEFFNETSDGDEDEVAAPRGSGFLIDAEKGYILTADHILDEGVAPYTVKLFDGRMVDAVVAGKDDYLNLAILKIEAADLAELTLSERPERVGQDVYILGRIGTFESPFATKGMLAGITNTVQDTRLPQKMLMLDALLPFASGGGPVIDSEGQVIGVATAVYTQSRISEGLAFATPLAGLREQLYSLAKNGQISRSYLGFTLECRDKFQVCLIDTVIAETPAALSGIQPGDQLLSIDGQAFSTRDAVQTYVLTRPSGTQFRVALKRADEIRSVELISVQVPKAE